MGSSKLHVALLTSPGLGHIIPFLLLGDRLAKHHNVDVTLLVVTTNTSEAETQLLFGQSNGQRPFEVVAIPPADISGKVSPNAKVVEMVSVMMRESVPAVRSVIAGMKHRPPGVLVVDIFATESLPIADEFHMAKYVFVTSSAWFAALTSYCWVLDKEIEGEYVDQKEPLVVPGCKPVRPEDVVDPMLDRNDPQYPEYRRQGIEYTMSDGIWINTWEDLERTSLLALRENEILRSVVKVPVYSIGPLRTNFKPVELKSELIQWLDKQPSESVIYVSFGSGGNLSAEQITELAWGLELSQQRFIWVLRPPTGGRSDDSYFTSGSGSDGNQGFLPDGFLHRTHNLGQLVPLWSPQVEILNHPSVGGFLSHCGWNSTLESITSGVPMIAWPLYAEQRLNATMLTEELGVAVRPAVLPTKKVVEREEIERMVRTLMQYEEGQAIRKRVKELKGSGEKALSKGGNSYDSLSGVLDDCQKRLGSQESSDCNNF